MHHKDEQKKILAEKKAHDTAVKHQVHDLEAIIKQWADDKAQAAGTVCKWIDLTYQNERTNRLKAGKKKYIEQDKFRLIPGKLTNHNTPKPIESERKSLGRKFEICQNPTNNPIPYKLCHTQQVVKHHVYTLNCGLTLSANLSANALVVQAQAGIELNLGMTKEQGKEFTESLQKEMSVNVEPQHKAVFRVETYLTPYEDDFTLNVEITGKVPMLFKQAVNYANQAFTKSTTGHELQFIPIVDIFEDLKKRNQLPLGLTCNMTAEKVVCVIEGKYKVDEYQAEVIAEKQEPLTPTQTPVTAIPAAKKATFFQAPLPKQAATGVAPKANAKSAPLAPPKVVPTRPKSVSVGNPGASAKAPLPKVNSHSPLATPPTSPKSGSPKYSRVLPFLLTETNSNIASSQTVFQSSHSNYTDLTQDIEQLKYLANKGDTQAQALLGRAYVLGEMIKKDMQEAEKWLRQAASKLETLPGQWAQGLCYEYGIGVAINYEQATVFYQKAADLEYAPAQNSLGLMKIKFNKNNYEAVELFKSAIKQDSAEAKYSLGVCYFMGHGGLIADKKATFKWYQKAADQGYAKALWNLGSLYMNLDKNDVPGQDVVLGMEYFKKAADKGYLSAMHEIGRLHYLGEKVEQDYDTAFIWIKKTAKLGLKYSYGLLGYFYENGIGVEIDKNKAVKWYKKDVDEGSLFSKDHLKKLGIEYSPSLRS